MAITGFVPQLRTTDLEATLRFYTQVLGFEIEFRYEDFYAGLRLGAQVLHLKRVDDPDPSIAWVAEEGHFHLYLQSDDVIAFAARLRAARVDLVVDVHDTAWQTREIVLHDDQGHTLYVGQALDQES